MKVETKDRKKAMAGFRQISNAEQQRQQMREIIQSGTRALNQVSLELGRQERGHPLGFAH
jgi:Spy/CpxP family protein refolding chaperone